MFLSHGTRFIKMLLQLFVTFMAMTYVFVLFSFLYNVGYLSVNLLSASWADLEQYFGKNLPLFSTQIEIYRLALKKTWWLGSVSIILKHSLMQDIIEDFICGSMSTAPLMVGDNEWGQN